MKKKKPRKSVAFEGGDDATTNGGDGGGDTPVGTYTYVWRGFIVFATNHICP